MRTSYFTILIFLLYLSPALNGQNQQLPPEIGIDEQLGDTIPKDFIFYNEKNEQVTLGKLVTKPTVFSFVYFDCPGLCSPLLEGISEVIERSDLELGEDYQIITISFNFQDNPEKAKDKKRQFLKTHSKERAEHWTYLTTDSTTIAKTLDAFGYHVKKMGFDWAHPSAIVTVSPEGKITRYLYGLNFLPFDFKMAINEAQKGVERPTINRVLQYCFSYDPEGKRYALDITRISGAFILIVALVIFTILAVRGRKKARS